MNGEGKTNIGLNLGTLAALLIALIAGGFIASDMYGIVQKIQTQNKANGDAVNQTLTQLLNIQQDANTRGNDSLMLFKTLLINQIDQGNKSLHNQQLYFPGFNESFAKIAKALNITDD